jgi:hypothetical protein
VFYADGNGNWLPGGTNNTFASDWKIYPGNYNSDAYTDLFLYNGAPSVHTATVLLSNTSGDWLAGPVDTSFGSNWRVYPGNYNSDQITDLYLYENSDGTPGSVLEQVLLGDGNGGWAGGSFPQQQLSTWRYIVPGLFAVPAASPTPTPSSSATASATPTEVATPTNTLSPTPTSTAAPDLKKGDIDCNGQIAVPDVRTLLSKVAGAPTSLPGGCTPDMNLDCTDPVASGVDALTLLLYLVGIIRQLPVGCAAIGSPIT